MRLSNLDHGHSLGTKALFVLIRAVSRQPVLDVVKLVKYRADFYGAPMQAVTQEAMRGPSEWSVADRELMAAFIAKTNKRSPFASLSTQSAGWRMRLGSPCPVLRLSRLARSICSPAVTGDPENRLDCVTRKLVESSGIGVLGCILGGEVGG